MIEREGFDMNKVSEPVIYGLFCLCHPQAGIKYVGRTLNGAHNRFRQHAYMANKSNTFLYSWMRKHGVDNIAYSVIEVCLAEELAEREYFWITELGTLGPGGKNQIRGEYEPKGFNRFTRKAPAVPSRLGAKNTDLHRLASGLAHRGEKNWNAVLNEATVRKIKIAFMQGATSSEVAKEFGISYANSRAIKIGRSWAWVK